MRSQVKHCRFNGVDSRFAIGFTLKITQSYLDCNPQGCVGAIYNVRGFNERANLKIVDRICSLLDVKLQPSEGQSYANQIAHVVDRPGHDRRYAIESARIRCELGWSPSTIFETGLGKVDWYLTHRN